MVRNYPSTSRKSYSMKARDFFTSANYTVGKGEYIGTLTTYARTEGSTKDDIRKIKAIIEEVRTKVGIHGNVFRVNPNRDIELYYYWIDGTFPNLFLPEEERTEESRVSFDTVVSYVLYRLAEAGYPYNGEVAVGVGTKFWKLRVSAGNVFRAEGKLCVIYNEDNEYQVGGIDL